MGKTLIFNCESREIRVGVLENQQLAELYIQHPVNQRVVGNIYKGRVSNILPGMQAAFIDIGLEKNAFLYVTDLLSDDDRLQAAKQVEQPAIKSLLQQGQELLVQVIKEPFGTKGARVTTNINIPGRYAVLMPQSQYIGISRKIDDNEERARLKAYADSFFQKGKCGIILRTAARDADIQQLELDSDYLLSVWETIRTEANKRKAPSLLHRDLEILPRILRDLLIEEIDEIVIDTYEEYVAVSNIIQEIAPKNRLIVRHHKERIPIFDFYQLEEEILKGLRPKVWLKNGGYLVIEATEALTVIDVNTGKYVGQRNLEETVVDTNVEAAKEVARQLRLRNISGIIIVDFIDMHIEENQRKVLQVLEKELERDRTKTLVLGITRLGLVEITRKKVRKSLSEMMYEGCTACKHTGRVLSKGAISNQIDREVRQILRYTKDEAIVIEMHRDLVDMFVGENDENLLKIEAKFSKRVLIRTSSDIEMQAYRIVYSGDEQEAVAICGKTKRENEACETKTINRLT